jgi:hypothetical protein
VNTGPFTKAWARCRPVTKLEQEARLKQRSHLVQGEGPGGGARHGSLGGEHDGQQAGDKELGSQIGAGLDPATLQRANGSINTALSLSLTVLGLKLMVSTLPHPQPFCFRLFFR